MTEVEFWNLVELVEDWRHKYVNAAIAERKVLVGKKLSDIKKRKKINSCKK